MIDIAVSVIYSQIGIDTVVLDRSCFLVFSFLFCADCACVNRLKMLKTSHTKVAKVVHYLLEFPNETFKSFKWLSCFILCRILESVSLWTQHINTTKHKENKERKIKFNQNFLIPTSISSNGKSIFNTELCRALIINKINKTDLLNRKIHFWKVFTLVKLYLYKMKVLFEKLRWRYL